MFIARICLVVLAWCATSVVLFAQTAAPKITLTILPPSGTNMIAETTNAISVTIGNYAFTNIDVDTSTDPPTTNTTVVTNYSNVTVSATFAYETNFLLLLFMDNGTKPDLARGDGIFTTNLITPASLVSTSIVLNFTIKGTDLTQTNDTGPIAVDFTNLLTVTYKLFPRPLNDKLTNAYKIPAIGGLVTATNNFASVEPGEPQHAKIATVDGSVWWTWSSPVNTNVLVDTAGSSFNPALAIYTNNAPTNSIKTLKLVTESADDAANKLKAHVNFDAIAGVTYRIVVAGQDSTNGFGSIRLRIVPGGQPDTSPPVVSITSPQKETISSSPNLSIRGTVKEPMVNDSGISNVVVQVNSLAPTNLFVSGDSWSASVFLPVGTNLVRAYAIDYAGNVGVADSVVVRYISPTNDLFASARVLSGVGNQVTANNTQATLEAGEPLHAFNAGGHSIWYAWRAPNNGILTLSTSGSTFDTLLDFYIGTNFASLVTVASNDDAALNSGYSLITQNVLSNQLYYIAVDGYGGAAGTVLLDYRLSTAAAGQYYSLTVTKPAGGTVSPPSGGVYLANSRVTLTATPSAQYEFVGWEGSMSTSSNPLQLTMNSDMTMTATFRLVATTMPTISDDFETGNLKRLTWVTGPAQAWNVVSNIVVTNLVTTNIYVTNLIYTNFVTTEIVTSVLVQTNLISGFPSGGKFVARAAVIKDGQKSILNLVTNMVAGAGAFDLKVSSEDHYDWLEFWLNGALVNRWTGEVDWTNYVFNVPAGTNALQWRYVKDASFSGGLDTAFIDNVALPLAMPTVTNTAPNLSITLMLDGSAQITLQGQPSRTYLLESSSDLEFWLPLSTGKSNSGIVQFWDADASSYGTRFYRAQAQ